MFDKKPGNKCFMLKGLCHKFISVLDQFCAKVRTWCFNQYTKYSRKVMKKISNKCHQGILTLIIFW